ncbi:sugar (pentulose and hexulose) kinase [Microbacterium testaceum StLB037]|uniref:Sugar (Pentulose and hexulose) kinase n=1 Tax=Microbacterium testaceum (strain StLB037) TaxID=979556 RepID=E8NGK9_MICTS|nr:FGGY family carbohydrate kinase [Microbacterium testaceum]BAJ74092.1 sugar (pentulose and hexulose) kinase [Microbacterium testaceum StLB037]
MGPLALALDLGTGGCKASLWSADGRAVAETVVAYPTRHPGPGRAEQRPQEWWDAVVSATREVVAQTPGAREAVVGIALSGQSLGVVQVDAAGELVARDTPIWSDTRGRTGEILDRIDEDAWYLRTGNGFGAQLYPVFKAQTMRAEDPEGWARTRSLLGSKDWITLRLTGEIATDHSMASGSGAYDLTRGDYDDTILDAAELDRSLLPTPRESADVVGTLRPAAADALGLPAGVPVHAGAVDNAAMALGSRGTTDGRIYAALGSSSWMTVTSSVPVLDVETRPYVFRHAVPGLYVSALSTFSSGTTVTWLRDVLRPGADIGAFIDGAAASPRGARGAVFVPTLAGGTPLEGGSGIRGTLAGIELGTAAEDLVRACLEGIAFALDRSLRHIRSLSGLPADTDLLISGGGSRSDVWNRIYADVLDTALLRTTVDQQAATLGAAALVFAGSGVWSSLGVADDAHRLIERLEPDPDGVRAYAASRDRYSAAADAAVLFARSTPSQETA